MRLEEEELSSDTKDLVDRLKRIAGQARGIQRMLQEGQPCGDVIVQLAAMKAALNKVAVILMGCHVVGLLCKEIREGRDPGKILAETAEIYGKFS